MTTATKKQNKSKIPVAKAPGASRQRVLGIMRLLLRGGMWPHEIAVRAGVSDRTVSRIVEDAKEVGFDVWADNGKIFASA